MGFLECWVGRGRRKGTWVVGVFAVGAGIEAVGVVVR